MTGTRVDYADGGVDDGVELLLGEVGRFTGAAQRCNRVCARGDESLDERGERSGVDAVAVGGERRDGIGDDAVDLCHGSVLKWWSGQWSRASGCWAMARRA